MTLPHTGRRMMHNRLTNKINIVTEKMPFHRYVEENAHIIISYGFVCLIMTCASAKDSTRSEILYTITKTYLYNFDPLIPHFYIAKLGFTGVYIIFLISAQKHRLWYSLEPPRRGGSNGYPQYMFLSRNMKKYQNFYLKTFSFWW